MCPSKNQYFANASTSRAAADGDPCRPMRRLFLSNARSYCRNRGENAVGCVSERGGGDLSFGGVRITQSVAAPLREDARVTNDSRIEYAMMRVMHYSTKDTKNGDENASGGGGSEKRANKRRRSGKRTTRFFRFCRSGAFFTKESRRTERESILEAYET